MLVLDSWVLKFWSRDWQLLAQTVDINAVTGNDRKFGQRLDLDVLPLIGQLEKVTCECGQDSQRI